MRATAWRNTANGRKCGMEKPWKHTQRRRKTAPPTLCIALAYLMTLALGCFGFVDMAVWQGWAFEGASGWLGLRATDLGEQAICAWWGWWRWMVWLLQVTRGGSHHLAVPLVTFAGHDGQSHGRHMGDSGGFARVCLLFSTTYPPPISHPSRSGVLSSCHFQSSHL